MQKWTWSNSETSRVRNPTPQGMSPTPTKTARLVLDYPCWLSPLPAIAVSRMPHPSWSRGCPDLRYQHMIRSQPPRERKWPGYMDLNTLYPFPALLLGKQLRCRSINCLLLVKIKQVCYCCWNLQLPSHQKLGQPATSSVVSLCSSTPTPSSTPAPTTSLTAPQLTALQVPFTSKGYTSGTIWKTIWLRFTLSNL